MEDDHMSEKHAMMEEFEKILADQERDSKEVENELRAKIDELLQKFK